LVSKNFTKQAQHEQAQAEVVLTSTSQFCRWGTSLTATTSALLALHQAIYIKLLWNYTLILFLSLLIQALPLQPRFLTPLHRSPTGFATS